VQNEDRPALGGTRCHGLTLSLLRFGWGLISALTLILALRAFLEVAGRESLDQLFRVGAYSLESAIVRGLTDVGVSRDLLIQADIGFRFVSFLAFSVTGAFMFLRRSDDWMTGLSSLMLITVGASWFAPAGALEGSFWTHLAQLVGATEPWAPEFGRSVAGMSLLLFSFLIPDGRFVPRWTKWVAAVVGLHVLLWTLLPGSVLDVRTWPDVGGAIWVGTLIVTTLSAQVYRLLFVSEKSVREQTQLVVGALATIAVTPALLFIVNPELGAGLPSLSIRTPELEAAYSVIVLLILMVALLLLPGSIAFSILRYRLWGFDIIVNRTLVYGTLTAVLGAGYFTIVAVVSSVAGRSYITVATATLLVAVLFQPLRRRLQDVIDRRFYRSKYDAARALNTFSARLRQEIDLETLAREVLGVVQAAMQPRDLSLWTVETPGSLDLRILTPVALPVSERFEAEPDDAAIGVFRATPGARSLDEALFDSAIVTRLRDQGIDVTVPLVSQGEFIGLLNLGPRLSGRPYSSDDLRLLDGLADHAAPAVRVALLVRVHESELRDRERLENEMLVAQLIQQQFLPKTLPDLPGWEIEASYRAARSVGGDFYDFIDLPGGRIALVIGDVTGKGVPAALVMATTRSIIRTDAPRLVEPGLVLASVNEQLNHDTPANMFVTCMYAVLDPRTGELRMANAGHNLPYVRRDTDVIEVKAKGMPLGLMASMVYEEVEARVEPGETILMHSDGMVEAHGPQREMFGGGRMKQAMLACPQGHGLIDSMLMALSEFTGHGWEQEDDITLVSLHRGARASTAARVWGAVDVTDERLAAES
jgi:serine phosphatase RsbU (regulator of sigma subunit)